MQIAIIRKTEKMDPIREAFVIAATNIQMREHFIPAWRGHLPSDDEHWPVVGYDDAPFADTGEYHPMYVMDAIGVDGALGFHDDELGLIFGRIRADAGDECWGHESMEMRADPLCESWWTMPDGRSVAAEVCDPVEVDTYPIEVSVGDDRRTVSVSNFILPSWLDPQGKAPFDHMGILTAPFTMSDGGYMIVRERDGTESDVFRSLGSGAKFSAKRLDPLSRTSRRVRVRR